MTVIPSESSLPSEAEAPYFAAVEGIPVVVPCLSFTLYLVQIDRAGVLDFYQRSLAALKSRLGFYQTHSMKSPRPMDARGLSIVPTQIAGLDDGKQCQVVCGSHPQGASAAELTLILLPHPLIGSDPAEEAKKKPRRVEMARRYGGNLNITLPGFLQVCFPLDHPLAIDPDQAVEFIRSFQLVREGRFLSGNCGLALNYDVGATSIARSEMIAALRALCARHPGFELPVSPGDTRLIIYQSATDEFIPLIRRVSWLTLVAPRAVQELGGETSLTPKLAGDDVRVQGLNGGLLIQAGPRPLPGDRLRHELLPAYRRVARALRPIRMAEFSGGPSADLSWMKEWLNAFDDEPI